MASNGKQHSQPKGRKQKWRLKTQRNLLLLSTICIASISALFCGTFSPQLLHAAPPSANHAPSSSNQPEGRKHFLVAPYLQLGDHPKLLKSEELEIVWFITKKPGDKDEWKAEVQTAETTAWKPLSMETKEMGLYQGTPYYRLTAAVNGLPPGQKFQYRISRANTIVFSASGTARKNFDQPYRFALFGDVGAGSPGQKKVAYHCLEQKPDFTIMPGDIVYDAGRVSEYLTRFFPIMNSDTHTPATGAPLLRSTVNIAAIGNHDIAFTGTLGTDFTRFPDALGYYVFWSQPLNGPFRLRNGKNSPMIIGNPELQQSFVKAAGERFPTMANCSFDYGNAHWLVLDGNPYMDWRDQKARAWVEKDLAKAQSKTWRFATFHQPGFSVDSAHHAEHRMRLLCDIFEQYKVDVVFAGHAHDYQRTFPLRFAVKLENGIMPHPNGLIDGTLKLDKKFDGTTNTRPDGIIYIVSGGGGAFLYQKAPPGPQDAFIEKFVSNCHSFTICDVNKNHFKLTQFSDKGTVLDQFAISKESANPDITSKTSIDVY